MSILNKYQAIQGEIPRQYDISNWTEKQFLLLFGMVKYLIVTSKTGKDTITINNVSWHAAEEKYLDGQHPFEEEMMYRIGHFTSDPAFHGRKCFFKFRTLITMVGNYLKKNPAAITEDMAVVINSTERLSWITKHYKEIQTKIGGTAVVPDTRNTTDASEILPTAAPKNLEVRFLEAKLTLINTLEIMLGSINKKDLKDLPTKDKLTLGLKILDELQNASKSKNISTTFNKINVYQSGREDLERGLLEASEK